MGELLNPEGELVPEEGKAVPKPPPPPPVVPAGWYPDPDNETGFRFGGVPSMRYFNGVHWTDDRVPMQRRQQVNQSPQQPIIIAQQIAPQPRVVVYNNSGTNHGLHLVLTIFTCGLWLPVWIIIAIIEAIK